jgi:hypothetical protein
LLGYCHFFKPYLFADYDSYMKEFIKRIVLDLFPELSGQHHLPRWGKVVGIRETPQKGDIADEFRPYFGVNVQVLTESGEPDPDFPIINDVPLPVGTGGHESGQLSYPEDGAFVKIAFAYGSPNHPFIRCILPHNRSLPAIDRGEQKTQFSDKSFTRIADDGSHERVTDQTIKDHSLKRDISSLENSEAFTQSNRHIEADDIHTIGGSKRVTADGGIMLHAGDRMELLSTGDVALSGKVSQKHTAPLSWVGSENENLFKMVSEVSAQLKSLSTTLSSHTHPSVGVITQATHVAQVATDTQAIKTRIDGITKP